MTEENNNVEETALEPEIDYTNNINFLARFACLYEGVSIASKKAKELGINPDKNSDWIKPLAFQKYIKERESDMIYQIRNWKNK
jgi:hypothetical protein